MRPEDRWLVHVLDVVSPVLAGILAARGAVVVVTLTGGRLGLAAPDDPSYWWRRA